jgi:2-succinyl-5-enolpyruvyl-6-hydroxy-3-cyclohexene-1-carboxylate synthase
MLNGKKNTPWIAQICAEHQITDVFICPGSRSAPLTLAFTRNPQFNCYSIVDERSAGYLALGMALSKKKPVVIVTTSGTAALNLSPAVAEAYYQGIPLIVMTADRPAEWIDQHDGQAIRQSSIFQSFIYGQYQLSGELYHADDLWYTQRLMNEIIIESNRKKGPVHLNISFREPLYEIEKISSSDVRVIHDLAISNTIGQSHVSLPVELITSKKCWILLGQDDYSAETIDLLQQGINEHHWVVAHETISNLPLSNSITYMNEIIHSQIESDSAPEIVIISGKQFISKKLKKYLRSLPQCIQIFVTTQDEWSDAFQQVRYIAHHSLSDFLFQMIQAPVQCDANFYNYYLNKQGEIKNNISDFLKTIPYSDLYVYQQIFNSIPSGSVIHLGNSTPVRYAQLFSGKNQEMYCNRGTSGIDGSVSTAIGYAIADAKKNHFVIIGDLSFEYDIHALMHAYVPDNIVIIVINNQGGNIFRIIEGSKDVDELEKYFETRIIRDFKNISAHYGLDYHISKTENELKEINQKISSYKKCIIEIQTDPEVSSEVYLSLFKELVNKKR